MYRWAVLWQATSLVLVGATLDFGYYSRLRLDMPISQVNCFEMPKYSADVFARKVYDGWRFPRQVGRTYSAPTSVPSGPSPNLNKILHRIDRLLPEADDIVKEHAKLVQDINSLKQAVFVPPFTEENRDYEDSVFHEIIETATNLPKTTSTLRPKTDSIPVVLLGGEINQRKTLKSQPIKFPEASSISLVGTAMSPLPKHPYPFVVKTPQRPLRVCMSSSPPTKQRPSLFQRLLSAIIPR